MKVDDLIPKYQLAGCLSSGLPVLGVACPRGCYTTLAAKICTCALAGSLFGLILRGVLR